MIVRLIFLAIKAAYALGSPLRWPWLSLLHVFKRGTEIPVVSPGVASAGLGSEVVRASANICVHTRKVLILSFCTLVFDVYGAREWAEGGRGSRRGWGEVKSAPLAAFNHLPVCKRPVLTSLPPCLTHVQRRVYCLFEALSITYRSLLPVPAWCQYYTTDAVYGQVFVSVYLVLKILVLARHFRAVFGALQSVASNTLEFGAYAAKEDQGCCPICYGESGSL